MKRLSYHDVLAIVADKPIEELILVGGQALNAWAEALGAADALSEGLYGAALSGDIDFLGIAPAAITFAEALGADVKVARLDDSTPNTAIAIFDYHGETTIIDFLNVLAGFSARELQQVREWAAIPEMPDGLNQRLRVMHPIHCLQSQLENVYGVLNRRDSADGERNVTRVQLAHEVAKRTVIRYLDESDPDSARASIEHIFQLAMRRPALRALEMDKIAIADAYPNDERLGQNFRDQRLPQLHGHLQSAIDKHNRDMRRRSELAATRKRKPK